MTRNKLYFVLLFASFIGFLYLFYTIQYSSNMSFNGCLIKKITGFPCPSCGTTRAVILIWQGQFLNSIYLNPFGIFVFIIMTLFPFWIFYDILFRKKTLFNSYIKTETIFKTKWIALLLIVLVLLNWIWNIKKEL
ncbi:MAG: DUF2752 domain-containing protein [Flavobacterium sp.]|nr:DUF2752 domain-containing protein [Flavobacterium sp.]